MERLVDVGGRALWATHVVRPLAIESPFGGLDFTLLPDVLDPAITSDERNAFSDRIVAIGCRHAAIRGLKCSIWDDAIDLANLGRFVAYEVPGDRHLVTTWFEEETFEEVVEFVADFEFTIGAPPTRFLLICLGGNAPEYEDCRTRAMDRFTLAWT